MAWQLDPHSPNGISKKPDPSYTPYFAGGPGKPSLLDSVNGKHGAVQITGGTNVTVDNSGTDIRISASGGGEGGGASAWGDITGTLADQTDLQAALDAKVDTDDQTAAEVSYDNTGIAATTAGNYNGSDTAQEMLDQLGQHVYNVELIVNDKAEGVHTHIGAEITPDVLALDAIVTSPDINWLGNENLDETLQKMLQYTEDTAGGGGGTDDQTAAEVPFTPAGDIAATDVQAALEELDTEKAPAVHTHLLADGATDVTATATELNYTGGVTSAIQTQLDGKIADTGDTMTGQFNIEYAYPTFKVRNTDTNQYAGAGFFLSNTATSMGDQAGVTHYMGINDASATQGFYAIDKTNVAGGGTGHLMLFDYNANTCQIYQPLTIGEVGTTLGTLKLAGNTSGTTTLQPASAASGTLTLPAATGTLLYGGGPLGTPASGTLTNATGLPVATGVSGLGAGVATFLATPSSANLASAVTGETGSGALVFATSPTLVTPNIGAATGTSLTTTSNIEVDGTANAFMILDRNASTNFAAFQFQTNNTTFATVGGYNNSTNNLHFNMDIAVAGKRDVLKFIVDTEAVFNDGGGDLDFRVEGDTQANLLFVDASTDRVGIANASPAVALDVTGEARVSTAGTNAASVLTVAGTQSPTNKDLSSSTNTIISNNTATNFVITDQSTTSTSYVDLATVSSVTATTGAKALVHFSIGTYNVASVKRVSVAVSGATTVAASDDWSIRNDGSAFIGTQSYSHLFTGLTPGSNTFTLKFKTASGTANFFERRITVEPL